MTAAYLALPVTRATDEDVWNTCLVCGFPRDGRGVVSEHHVGLPVEFLVRVRSNGGTTLRGLHERCWQQNGKPTAEVDPPMQFLELAILSKTERGRVLDFRADHAKHQKLVGDKCDTCQHEKNWQTLNQMPDALRLSMQGTAARIDSDKCRLAKMGEHVPAGGTP